MAFDDNSYSRLVAWLKVVLPLVALLLLSTLFLVARTVDPAQQLPFADVDVDEIARDQRIGGPKYTGVTSEGAAIALSADAAKPAPEDRNRINGTEVRAEIALPDGELIEVQAARMLLDHTRALATLVDAVEISSASGLRMRTAALEIALDRTAVRSGSRTTVTGAIGDLSANSFELKASEEAASSHVLVFKGDVRLIYKPSE